MPESRLVRRYLCVQDWELARQQQLGSCAANGGLVIRNQALCKAVVPRADARTGKTITYSRASSVSDPSELGSVPESRLVPRSLCVQDWELARLQQLGSRAANGGLVVRSQALCNGRGATG